MLGIKSKEESDGATENFKIYAVLIRMELYYMTQY